jgi:hypothetical protein
VSSVCSPFSCLLHVKAILFWDFHALDDSIQELVSKIKELARQYLTHSLLTNFAIHLAYTSLTALQVGKKLVWLRREFPATAASHWTGTSG